MKPAFNLTLSSGKEETSAALKSLLKSGETIDVKKELRKIQEKHRYTSYPSRSAATIYLSKAASKDFFLVNYVEERPWHPVRSPNKGRKKKAKG